MSAGPCLCGDPECRRCFPQSERRPTGRCAKCRKFAKDDLCDKCYDELQDEHAFNEDTKLDIPR